MPAPQYHFVTHWRVEGTMEEVCEILSNALDLPRWWPSVYLEVSQPEAVGPVELFTRGFLPYRIHWFSRVIESHLPYGYSLEAWGDLEGRGVWKFQQDGECVNITYDWRVRACKRLLRLFSFVFRPLFSANHRWAMERGEESLKAELARRAGAGQHPVWQKS